ncbi:MAG: LysR family transcriptional regulator [Myxococcales bacterium]|nr:LysR family transcriptional regulator [Myxococcales bacterium]
MEWLNYHHLLYFWVIAREGGLAPAGKILRLSHPTLSAQVKKLEESLGVALFEKRGRKLALTETGRVAYRYASEIFGLGGELRDAIRGQRGAGPMRLVVGISDVVPKLLVRHLLAPALALAEAPTLVCREDQFDRLLADLAGHELDVVIADAPVPPGAAVRAFSHLLGESAVTALAPPALARSLRKGFPRGLDHAPMLLPLPGSPLRRALNAWFARHELTPRVVAEAEDSALLKAFAADGMGLVFAPSVIAAPVARQYDLVAIGEADGVRDRFYAISIERKLVHPAVVAIRDAARHDLFG